MKRLTISKVPLHLRPAFWQASYGLGELMLKKNRFERGSGRAVASG
jgi:hypothetical protein